MEKAGQENIERLRTQLEVENRKQINDLRNKYESMLAELRAKIEEIQDNAHQSSKAKIMELEA